MAAKVDKKNEKVLLPIPVLLARISRLKGLMKPEMTEEEKKESGTKEAVETIADDAPGNLHNGIA